MGPCAGFRLSNSWSRPGGGEARGPGQLAGRAIACGSALAEALSRGEWGRTFGMSRDERFRRAREIAAERSRRRAPVRNDIIAAYRHVHGGDPPSTSADSDAMKALVEWFSEDSDTEPPRLNGRQTRLLREALSRTPSLFDVACRLCPGFPKQLKQTDYVWISHGGQVYHRYRDCPALKAGKDKAGTGRQGLRRITLEQAKRTPGFQTRARRPCKWCRP